MRETIDTTYADLRSTDLVIDKSGQAWPIAELGPEEPVVGVNFWLCDPATGVKMHYMTKLRIDPVKVSRKATQADEASKLEAEMPVQEAEPLFLVDTETGEACPTDGINLCTVSKSQTSHRHRDGRKPLEMASAVAAVEEIGGTVEAEVTAAEVDAAAAATDDAPLSQPPFADMTPLEQRSHLYLLHGIYGSDVTGKAELIAIHTEAHTQHDAGTLNSRHVPHVHEEA